MLSGGCVSSFKAAQHNTSGTITVYHLSFYTQCIHMSLFSSLGVIVNTMKGKTYIIHHEPMYWSMTDQHRVTFLQGKQVQDVSLWLPNQFRPRQTTGNSIGHSLTQVSECGNKLNQAWESCTTTGWSGDQITMQSGMTFKGINQHTQESHASQCDITHAK